MRAGAGAAAGLLRPPGAVHGVPQGDSGRPAVQTCLFLRGITFLLRFGRGRPAVPGRLPERGGSVFLWQFFPRCGILPHCFSGEAMT